MSRTTTIEQQPTTNSQPPPNEMYVNMYTIFFPATLPYIRALISRVAEENDKTTKNLRFSPPQGHRAGEGAKGFLLDTTTSTMFKKKIQKHKKTFSVQSFRCCRKRETVFWGKAYCLEPLYMPKFGSRPFCFLDPLFLFCVLIAPFCFAKRGKEGANGGGESG